MFDPKKLEEITKQITASMPEGMKSFAEESEQKVKQVLQAQFSKLDLVTREEFDIQNQVLIRTREKLEQLERRLEELEADGSEQNSSQQGDVQG